MPLCIFWTWMASFLLFSGSLMTQAELYKPSKPIRCCEEQQCPQEWPCCSPYGECGAGPICLGGCNPKYSFDKLSCAPMPALLPPFKVHFAAKPNSKPESSVISPDEKLKQNGMTHFTDYLVTKDKREAEKMLKDYSFVYSGPVNMHGPSGDIILTMPRKSTGSLIAESQSFLYGRAGVRLKTGRSRGVITAIVLISAVGDEVDYECLGSQRNQVQTNYYSKGELDYTKMKRVPLSSDSWVNYHNYEIDWNEERIQWVVDGQVVRTLRKIETWDSKLGKFKYPQTPMRLEVALWPGGSENNLPGTIEWAGGPIDWENSPDLVEAGAFAAQVSHISVVPYSNAFVPAMANCLNQGNRITYAYGSSPGKDFNQNILEWYCDMVPSVPGWKGSGSNILRTEPLAATIMKREMIPVSREENFISDIRRLSVRTNGTLLFNNTKNNTRLKRLSTLSSSSGAWRQANPLWRMFHQLRQWHELI